MSLNLYLLQGYFIIFLSPFCLNARVIAMLMITLWLIHTHTSEHTSPFLSLYRFLSLSSSSLVLLSCVERLSALFCLSLCLPGDGGEIGKIAVGLRFDTTTTCDCLDMNLRWDLWMDNVRLHHRLWVKAFVVIIVKSSTPFLMSKIIIGNVTPKWMWKKSLLFLSYDKKLSFGYS